MSSIFFSKIRISCFCHNAMKISMVNKLAIVNRLVLRTFHWIIIAIMIRKITKKIKNLKCGGKWIRAFHSYFSLKISMRY